MIADVPLAVCAMVSVAHPNGEMVEDLVLPSSVPGPLSEAIGIAPTMIRERRVDTTPWVHPNDDETLAIRGLRDRSATGAFQVCFDAMGNAIAVTMMESTRLRNLDTRLIEMFEAWKIDPVVFDGRAVPVCTEVGGSYAVRGSQARALAALRYAPTMQRGVVSVVFLCLVPTAALAGPSEVPCSSAALVQAFHDANAAGGGTIELAAGCVYTLDDRAPDEDLGFWFGPTGLPLVTSAIVVEGRGATIARDPDAAPFRLIAVAGPAGQLPGITPAYPASGSLTLRQVTLRGGFARGGDAGPMAGGGAGLGGAALVQGELVLDQVTLVDNVAQGGAGGGTRPAVSNYGGGGGGLGGDGGAANASISGGGGGFLGDGDYAGGGAITSATGGTPGTAGTLPAPWGTGSPAIGAGGAVSGLPGGFGGGGGGRTCGVTPGGQGGTGGGAAGSCGTSAFFGGFGGGGGGGAGGAGDNLGGAGGFGAGGGQSAPSIFGGANGTTVSGGGGAGLGGAIFVHGGVLTATNTTMADNVARRSDLPGARGNGRGGAVFVLNGTVTLSSCTLAGNRAQAAGAVYALHLTEATTANAPTTVTITNSILAGSRDEALAPATDCEAVGAPTLVSGGNGVIERAGTCVLAGAGDQVGVAPLLAVVGDQGGLVPTMAPLDGSPALGAGSCVDGVDARGVVRAPPCASGAFQPGTYPVTVTIDGMGTVVSDTGVVDCGATCAGGVDPVEGIVLVAVPDPAWQFAGWSDACAGSFPACVLHATGAVAVHAMFTPAPSDTPDAGASPDAGGPEVDGDGGGCCQAGSSELPLGGAMLGVLSLLALPRRRRSR